MFFVILAMLILGEENRAFNTVSQIAQLRHRRKYLSQSPRRTQRGRREDVAGDWEVADPPSSDYGEISAPVVATKIPATIPFRLIRAAPGSVLRSGAPVHPRFHIPFSEESVRIPLIRVLLFRRFATDPSDKSVLIRLIRGFPLSAPLSDRN